METRPDTEIYQVPKRKEYDFKKINLKDPLVWAAFGRGDTIGIFQLESHLGIQWTKKMKPTSIKELSDVISAIRPGVLEAGMSDAYVKRRNQEEEATTHIHPVLDEILKDTYACLFYQEQSIKVAQEIAGYSETEADLLRKSLGKKLPEEVAKQKIIFIDGAIKKGMVTKEQAEQIFSWIEKGQRYLFNLSHSVSYAMTAYQCMYQKVHFPTEFFCGWLTFSKDKPDSLEEVNKLVNDAKLHSINILQPSIVRKNLDFEIVKEKEIIFGLSHIRGIGASSVATLKKLKIEGFYSLLSYTRKIKRSVAESLIKSGACDSYKIPRIQMLRILNAIYGRSKPTNDEEREPPQVRKLTDKELPAFLNHIHLGIEQALLKIIETKSCVKARLPIIEAKIKWLQESKEDTNRQNAIWEKLYLGISLSCSAADDFDKIDKESINCKRALNTFKNDKFCVHAVIDSINTRTTGPKSKIPGREYCTLAVSDNTCQINVTVWPDLYEKVKENLNEGVVVTIYIKNDEWNSKTQLIANNIIVIG